MESGRVVGERVNAKNPSSAFQPGANIAFALSATNLLVSIFRGYGSSIGDGTKFVFDLETSNRLTISGESSKFQCVDITGSTVSNMVVINGDAAQIDDFSIVGTGTTTNSHTALQLLDGNAFNGYIENNSTAAGTSGICLTISRATVSRCEVVSTRVGIRADMSSRPTTISDTLVYEKGSSAVTGILLNNGSGQVASTFNNLTVDGYTTSIDLTSTPLITATTPIIFSNLILSNATQGIASTDVASATMPVYMSTIAFYNISGADTEFGDNPVINSIALTVEPYTDAASNDYSLNNTAGGGADCRAAQLFAGGKTANFRDIGAMQHEDTGGGGGGISTLIGEGGLIG